VSAFASVSNDRRTAGAIIDDKSLHMKLGSIIRDDEMLENAHLKFMVYGKIAVVAGEVPNEEVKDYLAKQLKQNAPIMKQLINEAAVMPSISLFSKSKDNIITLQIETLFQNQEVFHPTHVKVMTERQIVYLMGSVTKREAEHATNQAAKAKNVAKVVKLFDYLSARPAEEIERENKNKAEAERKAALEAKKTELEEAQKELQKQLDELYTN
jgi:osmotically-inducible protein OsmY|tara:strand:+ start:286 stop:921 length:636 start_codon:yes stop_codon:yes gene_type:complete